MDGKISEGCVIMIINSVDKLKKIVVGLGLENRLSDERITEYFTKVEGCINSDMVLLFTLFDIKDFYYLLENVDDIDDILKYLELEEVRDVVVPTIEKEKRKKEEVLNDLIYVRGFARKFDEELRNITLEKYKKIVEKFA